MVLEDRKTVEAQQKDSALVLTASPSSTELPAPPVAQRAGGPNSTIMLSTRPASNSAYADG
eukprot:SAG22_NODE_3562_length_1640_cov_2.134328_3_plen_61_part_00